MDRRRGLRVIEPARYYAGIGNPQNFRVTYDAENKRLRGYWKQSKLKFCCYLVSVNLKLRCYFLVSNGDFCGIEYECDLDKVKRKSINNYFAPSGYVNMRKNKSAAYRENFVAFFSNEEFYDEGKRVLAIGDVKEDYPSFRVCDNVIVGLNGEHVCYILIEL